MAVIFSSSFTTPRLPLHYFLSPSVCHLDDMTCSFPFVLCYIWIICKTFVFCLILLFVIFICSFRPNIALSIPHWVTLSLLAKCFVRLSVSAPYITGSTHWLKMFLFRKIGKSPFNINSEFCLVALSISYVLWCR